MSPITTHILDTTRGRPAAHVSVLLERRIDEDRWENVGRGETDDDGRLRSLMTESTPLTPGIYRLTFDTQAYFETGGTQAFLPQVVIVFRTAPGEAHYHVPLLLNPFGYTTYRGS